MSVYVVDSNFFIEAHRRSYPLDVATGFWAKVKQLADQGTILSIDKVKHEIFKKEDALKDWCEQNLDPGFFRDSGDSLAKYAEVIRWASSMATHYKPSALLEFLDADEADAWLVAFSLVEPNERIIVTYEVSDPNNRKKIKISEACVSCGAQYINPIEMFRRLGERF
ncbi:MAG: DUF4411 family protein [Bacteroidetes bacterium]|nr:DUF4411 family protein [Bacteroidota bacterium]